MSALSRDFYDYTREELARALQQQFGWPAFRAAQLFKWVYRKGITRFPEMSDLSRAARRELSEFFLFPEVGFAARRLSRDGSRKYLLRLQDGECIETVLVNQPARRTVCLSSQVGCALGCAFCRTGAMGFKRNLSAAEIVRQLLVVQADAGSGAGQAFDNIVFMGMGEPLANFEQVRRALLILGDEYGLGISGRRVTLSTAGLVPGIDELALSGLKVNLAVSLNATSDEVRSALMPVNKVYPIKELIACLRRYPLKRRQRITIEYVLIAGVNDSDNDCRRLPRLLSGLRCKINLIPCNSLAESGFAAPSTVRLELWCDRILKHGIETTIRWSKGQDIQAACGQLAVSASPAADLGDKDNASQAGADTSTDPGQQAKANL